MSQTVLRTVTPADTNIHFQSEAAAVYGLPESGMIRFQLADGSALTVDVENDCIHVRVTEPDGGEDEHGRMLVVSVHGGDEITVGTK